MSGERFSRRDYHVWGTRIVRVIHQRGTDATSSNNVNTARNALLDTHILGTYSLSFVV